MMAYGRIRPLWPVLISVLLALFATGCSTSTENGGLSLVDEQGNHPANFLSTHPAFAVSSVAQCRPCHGDDLTGGIANTSCYTAACHHGTQAGWVVFPSGPPQGHGISAKKAPGSSGFASCQICHASDFNGGGAGVSCFLCHATAPHPQSWRSFDVYQHTDTDQANAPVCAQCHLAGANSPVPPPSPPAPAGTSPGCFNSTLCHGADTTPHGVPFLNHTSVTDNTFNDPFPAGCASCHGVTGTSPVAAAPLCTTCHTGGSPLTFLNCSSCHSEPPGGVAYPNVGGAHPTHDGLAGVTGVCDSCHNGLGTGTLAHYNGANARPGKDALRVPPGDVAFLSNFNAQSGPGSFDNAALTCTNVSCHGGQTTPDWQTGAINPDTDCESCHVSGTTQFNGFFSGRHVTHVPFYVPGFSVVPPCVACHDTVKLADPAVGAHHDNLVTTAIDTRASVTIGGGTTLVQTYVPGPTTGTGTCTPDPASGCHATNPTRNW